MIETTSKYADFVLGLCPYFFVVLICLLFLKKLLHLLVEEKSLFCSEESETVQAYHSS